MPAVHKNGLRAHGGLRLARPSAGKEDYRGLSGSKIVLWRRGVGKVEGRGGAP